MTGKLDELGNIEVRIQRLRLGPKNPPTIKKKPRKKKSSRATKASDPSTLDADSELLKNGTVPEKNLKGEAISHQAKYVKLQTHKGVANEHID